MLADVCGSCSAAPSAFLSRYAGRGRDALALVAVAHTPCRRPRSSHITTARLSIAAAYVLMGLAAFLLVTIGETYLR